MIEVIGPIIGVIVGVGMTYLTTFLLERSRWQREERDREGSRKFQKELEDQRKRSDYRRERLEPLMKSLDGLATSIHFTSIMDRPEFLSLPKELRETLEELGKFASSEATKMLGELSVITDTRARSRVTNVALVMMAKGEIRKMLLEALKFPSTVDALEDAYTALEEYVIAQALA